MLPNQSLDLLLSAHLLLAGSRFLWGNCIQITT